MLTPSSTMGSGAVRGTKIRTTFPKTPQESTTRPALSASVESFFAAAIAALVLGLINAVVRPILVILTFPVTLLTLGLFIFVINALLFWLAAEIVKGFTVTGFMGALIGSILYSVITLITSWILFGGKKS